MSDSPFVDFSPGTAILREGEPASALFIIESGKVAILRSEAPDVVLAELGPGEFFGEMSVLQEQPHTASAIAQTNVRALRIDVASFHAVLRENVEIAVHLMRRLVLRLKASEQRRVQLEQGGTRGSGGPAISSMATPLPPPSPTMMQAPVLGYVVKHPDGALPLAGGKTDLLVGRPDPATGAIPEINLGPLDVARTLSRRHARVLVQDGRLSLREEPGVGNGTWVNGERVQPGQTVPLKAGDMLRFGAVEVQLAQA